MPLIGPFFFVLGLIMASAMENETTTDEGLIQAKQGLNSSQYNLTNEMPSTNTTMHIANMSDTASDMNITSPNITTAPSTRAPSTTERKGGGTTKGGIINSIGPAKTTSDKNTEKNKKTTAQPNTGGDTTGIVILIVIIIVAVGFGIACCIVRKRGRRYSVDFASRQDEAHIPLSIVDPELPADTVSQNGLKTFENTEMKAKEPQEPEGHEEQKAESKSVAEVSPTLKAEADKSVVDPGAETAAAAPSPQDSEDKPKEDVAEPSPTPAPVQPSAEEKTDDEGTVSNKTSVESLKETNENNSNNADFRQTTELDSRNIFMDVPLDSPV